MKITYQLLMAMYMLLESQFNVDLNDSAFWRRQITEYMPRFIFGVTLSKCKTFPMVFTAVKYKHIEYTGYKWGTRSEDRLTGTLYDNQWSDYLILPGEVFPRTRLQPSGQIGHLLSYDGLERIYLPDLIEITSWNLIVKDAPYREYTLNYDNGGKVIRDRDEIRANMMKENSDLIDWFDFIERHPDVRVDVEPVYGIK